ncbi:hypothetical protein RFI_29580 [Reticulomyxa filosa]|uniref:Actin n=1 Tax=Reticulomyxa filosa TaxID=46433 RepID=X6M2K4_RETFI|nr:hypothetical protein RFI_29580 [Reticulomyxa filosa]|eukprot:ETO07811.1 hypothetical protein RFI_29580 [Reticulomyxa filosa]
MRAQDWIIEKNLMEEYIYSKHSLIRKLCDTLRKNCTVALDYDGELKKASTIGKAIIVGAERFKCPEVLFKPNFMDLNENVCKLTFQSIMKCDIDIRKNLRNNIVIGGDTTMFNSIAERMQNEIKDLYRLHCNMIALSISVWKVKRRKRDVHKFPINSSPPTTRTSLDCKTKTEQQNRVSVEFTYNIYKYVYMCIYSNHLKRSSYLFITTTYYQNIVFFANAYVCVVFANKEREDSPSQTMDHYRSISKTKKKEKAKSV